MAKVVISGRRRAPIIWITTGLLGIGALVFYSHIRGSMPAGSLYFGLFGPAVFPIFYVLLFFGLYGLFGVWRISEEYLSVDEDQLHVGNSKPLPRGEIRKFHADEKNAPAQIVVELRNGVPRKIPTRFLQEHQGVVLARLQEWLSGGVPGERAEQR